MTDLKKTILKNDIIFKIEEDHILRKLYDPVKKNETLYLYKYGPGFYVARNRMYIIPQCQEKNIIEIKEDSCCLPAHLKLAGDYAVFSPRSEYLYALNSDEKTNRLLLSIFVD